MSLHNPLTYPERVFVQNLSLGSVVDVEVSSEPDPRA
jgi:hypothetical protein